MVDVRRIVLSRERAQLSAMLNAFADLASPEIRPKIVAEYRQRKPDNSLKDDLSEVAMFHRQELMLLVFDHVWRNGLSGKGLSSSIYQNIITVLEKNLMISRPMTGIIELTPVIEILRDSGNLDFTLLGMPYVVEIMKDAVVAINTIDNYGDEQCGSGVILHSDLSGTGIVLTNRHVIESGKIKSVAVGEDELEITSDPIHHSNLDLSKFNVTLIPKIPRANLAYDIGDLDEVVAMGYPRIPTAAGQFVMAHKGEVNGRVRTIDNFEFLAISCHVSPGNSGGPIFNKFGYCAGLVTRSGIADFGSASDVGSTYRSVYHMAIPVEQLKAFVSRT